MIKLEMISAIAYDDITIYDVKGDLNGSVEVQFYNGEFNGKIYFCEECQEDEEEEWRELKVGEMYNYIKEKAIKDYNGEI